MTFYSVGNDWECHVIPSDELHHFSEVFKPPTRWGQDFVAADAQQNLRKKNHMT
jgi:hypothetical protein